MANAKAPGSEGSITIRLFGAFEAEVNGLPIGKLRTRKEAWLLALLALAKGRALDRGALARTLWPLSDTLEGRAAQNLRRSLSELRQALGEEAGRLLTPTSRMVALDLTGAEVDLIAFERALTHGDTASLELAIALYRGPLLADCNEPWIWPEREARQRSYRDALLRLAENVKADGELNAQIGYLRQAVHADPLWEAARRELMESLACNGDLSEALQLYRDLGKQLQREDALSVPDPQTSTLYHRLRAEALRQSKPTKTATAEASKLPDAPGFLPRLPPHFVGRDDEIAEIDQRLRDARLVTLTGPGGIGKTRLAVAAATRIVRDYPDGVWFVDLASLSSGDRLVDVTSTTLGVREEAGRSRLDTLVGFLRNRCCLLILDNAEHLRDDCTALTEALLAACSDIRILVTSRRKLNIALENEMPLSPLSVPDPDRLPSGWTTLRGMLSAYEGVQLFIERATAADKAFDLTRENAAAVVKLCAHLEGIPLAIELAAARIGRLKPEQILEEVAGRLNFLTTRRHDVAARHRSMRAAITWSYDALSPELKTLFAQLSLFRGGWTPEAATSMCCAQGGPEEENVDQTSPITSPSDAIRQSLEQLREASLIQVHDESDGVVSRFAMLETLREFAEAQLKESDKENNLVQIRRRHADYFLRFLEEMEKQLAGAEVVAVLKRLDEEQSNVRTALEWFVTSDPATALRMTCALRQYWIMRGVWCEGREWIQRALEWPETEEMLLLRAEALNQAGVLAYSAGELKETRVAWEGCLTLWRRLADRKGIAIGLENLGILAWSRNELDEARVLLEQSLQITREMPEPRSIAQTLNNLGLVALDQGDRTAAHEYHSGSLALKRELGDRWEIGSSLINLGLVEQFQGHYASARALYEESLVLYRDLQDRTGIAVALLNMGQTLRLEGNLASSRLRTEESLALLLELDQQPYIVSALEEFARLAVARNAWEQAALLFGVCGAQRERTGIPLPASERESMESAIEETRSALGEKPFVLLWEQGCSTTLEQAVEVAMEEPGSN